uniref:Tumor necrosis factor receptor superfamily member 11B-like n=1 Tax=Saccoglossus kowalevskii TaxID=10224 RepID=A0ABM0MGS3_SACKO|nr:PREDICTED: tumor necrosis factor receptor superfamily member 11B-like [Saccoglossus kowalevskii]
MKLRLFVTVILATLLQINVVASKCYKGKSSEKRTFQHRGVRCYLCPPGTYMVKPCTQSSSTRCSTCGNNTYIDRFNYCTQCWGCTQLCNYRDQYVKLECSPTQKRVCACVPGKRMFGDMCQDITECEPGYYMKRENNHKCAPCPRGTYSNTHNVNENCTPHTNCTMFGLKYKRKGNRTSDVSCYDDIDVTSTPPVATTGVTSDDTNKGFSTSTDEESTTKVEELHITADGTHTQLKGMF